MYHKQFMIFIELVRLYWHHQNAVLECIHCPQKFLVPVSGYFPSTIHPSTGDTWFTFLQICIFWMFHNNGINYVIRTYVYIIYLPSIICHASMSIRCLMQECNFSFSFLSSIPVCGYTTFDPAPSQSHSVVLRCGMTPEFLQGHVSSLFWEHSEEADTVYTCQLKLSSLVPCSLLCL